VRLLCSGRCRGADFVDVCLLSFGQKLVATWM
jgi:hypothetical protein